MDLPIYDFNYFQSTNYHSYFGLRYRLYHYLRYTILGLYYKHFLKVRTILDLGCAHGISVYIFRHLGLEAYGIDISSDAISHCHSNIKPYLTVGNITQNNLHLPLSHFDLVVSYDTLEHLPPQKLHKFLQHIFKHTSRAVFGIYVTDEPIARLHRLAGFTHPDHLSEHPRHWWLNFFGQHRLRATPLPFSRPGSFLVCPN
jgi:SAM-dependent methyltransferase